MPSCQMSPKMRLKVILVFFVPLVKPSTREVNTKLTLRGVWRVALGSCHVMSCHVSRPAAGGRSSHKGSSVHATYMLTSIDRSVDSSSTWSRLEQAPMMS